MDRFVYISAVEVYDDEVFTKSRADEWRNHFLDAYEYVTDELEKKIDKVSNIKFFVNKSLIEEAIIDAIIGMRKITDSRFNSVENPNAFKIAAYLTYWWLRHKPACVHYPLQCSMDDVEIFGDFDNDEDKEYARRKLIWQLKHINELVAVQAVLTFIFDFDKVLCGKWSCEFIKRREKECFCFDSFEEMRNVVLDKLTYYFSYRALAPKMIEHMLEGYTFHPAWGLTGAHWKEKGGELHE